MRPSKYKHPISENNKKWEERNNAFHENFTKFLEDLSNEEKSFDCEIKMYNKDKYMFYFIVDPKERTLELKLEIIEKTSSVNIFELLVRLVMNFNIIYVSKIHDTVIIRNISEKMKNIIKYIHNKHFTVRFTLEEETTDSLIFKKTEHSRNGDHLKFI